MQGLQVILKWHNLQGLNIAMDIFIEFEFCESNFYFLSGSKIVWWLLITSVQCIMCSRAVSTRIKARF